MMMDIAPLIYSIIFLIYYIKQLMKRKQSVILQYNPNRLQFLIHPLKLTTTNRSSQSPPTTYKLQIQKGVQYIKSLKDELTFHNKHEHKFDRNDCCTLIINRKAITNYTLSFYRCVQEGIQFQDKIDLNLDKLFEDYLSQLKMYANDINGLSTGKQDISSWMGIKKQFKTNKSEQSYVSDGKGFKLQFSVEIEIDFDFMVKQPVKKIVKRMSSDSIRSLESNKSTKNKQASKNKIQNIPKINIKLPQKPSIQENKAMDEVSTIQLTSKQSLIEQFKIIKEQIDEDKHFQNDLDMLDQNLMAKEKHQMNVKQWDLIEDRRGDLLSDIMEASNEGSSLINNNGANTDRKISLMTLIPEEEHHEESYYRAKTFEMMNEEEEPLMQRRRNISQLIIGDRAKLINNTQEDEEIIKQQQAVTSISKITQNNVKCSLEENISTEVSQTDNQEIKKCIKAKTLGLWIILLIILSVINIKMITGLRTQLDFTCVKKAKFTTRTKMHIVGEKKTSKKANKRRVK